ncbi:adenylate cyclase [Niastella yeongjuensis]|uniref:Adenylate cyclase n=1 Tax=Niastella yeongjuensis TaxID=354355 RepID=A0A1V9EME3_9BACT|nr:CYTH domain-containing protein [Niastella yeongjuensis]OQP47323.1 adenylate cyclase [Niastella yeongjuensis]SEN78771.1 CYTH domain-containing protein [Niastella yeongjuensis]
MGIEIERKFLVNKEKWNQVKKEKRSLYRQGYIVSDPEKTIRVRLTDNEAFLTIKGLSVGASRPEFEYSIPVDEAQQLLDGFCDTVVSKIRNFITYDNKLWEVDEFHGDNEGLIVAEIELDDENESFSRPEWISEEVTSEKKYSNSNLAKKPYKSW